MHNGSLVGVSLDPLLLIVSLSDANVHVQVSLSRFPKPQVSSAHFLHKP